MTMTVDQKRAKAEAERAADEKRRRFLRVTRDCAVVEWAGVVYEFDEWQRKVVARLWAVREDDEPYETGGRLLALSGSRLPSLRELFKGQPAWGLVVVPVPAVAKLEGCYMLGAIPEDW